MTYPNLQQWQYIELTMKDKSSGTSSTYYLSNRAIIDDTNVGRYFPLIKSIGSLGSRMGTFLPESTSATITLDDSPGSYGYERRFSDLLERQTPIQQSIKIYLAQTELTDLNVTADFVLAWQGVVVGVDMDRGDGNDRLSLKVSSVSIPVRELGRKIFYTDEFYAAHVTQDNAYGQIIPLVLGDGVQVKPLALEAPWMLPSAYGYAVIMGTQYPVGGVTHYWAKDKLGRYVEVTSPASLSTVAAGNDYTPNTNGVTISNSYTSLVPFTKPEGYLLRKASVSIQSAITGSAAYSISIFRAAGTEGGGRLEIANAAITSTSYTTGNNYTLDFYFTQPVVIEEDTYYYFGISSNVASSSYWRYESGVGTSGNYKLTHSDGPYGYWETLGSTNAHVFKLYAATFTDNKDGTGFTTDENGYNIANVDIDVGSAAPYDNTGILKNLDLVFTVQGLKDDSLGTITGVANTLIESPVHAIKLLDKAWNGSTWTGGSFDFSVFSTEQTAATTTTNRWYRKIAGATNGRTLVSDLMAYVA